MSCPGWQQCSPSLLAVTNPCSVLTLAPLLPTSPGRPRGPSGPGSPCEECKEIPGQGCLQCCWCAWQCSLERGGVMQFSNLVFLSLKHNVRAVCPPNMSLSLELCCPSRPLWIKPWKRRLYLLPPGQAAGTVGAEHRCRAHWDLQFPALVLDTSRLGSSASHTHQSCAPRAHLQWSGQLLYSPFLLWPQECLCCLSSLDLHVDPWQTQKVT